MPAEAPSTIGRYEIRRELGRGMMGVVYEARDSALGRDIALKVIQPAFVRSEQERQGFEQRFFAEARAAAGLSHPGIVVVHDVGRDASSGALFMALELLRGETLDHALKERGALAWREALRIAQRVAEALQHAHASNIVHRDIKPANIMLSSSREPKIMDFGIAKVEASQLTASGEFLGTPLYMSPEQALAHPLDGRSDLFSLGSVLYEMLTGRPAFAGETVTKILFQVVGREPEPVGAVARGFPQSVEYVLARCLAKDVARRYPDGRTLAADLEDVLAGRVPSGQASWRPAVPAQGTLIGGAAPTLAPVAEATAKVPAPPRPPLPQHPAERKRMGVAIAVVTLAAVLVGFLLVRVLAPPVARRVTPTPPPVDTARDAPATDAAPSAPQKRGDDDDQGSARPAAAGTARLFIDFEHPLKSGTLRVWVDDHLVIEDAFSGHVTRKIGKLEMRNGRATEALDVAPGRREVRVQVSWEEGARTGTAWANFKAGATLHLKARLGSFGGIRKDLSLDWD